MENDSFFFFQIFQKHPLQEYYPPPNWGPLVTPNDTLNENSTFTTDSPGVTSGMTNVTTTSAPEPYVMPPQPNTALLSLCLCLATYALATKLKKFRNSKYLGRSVSRFDIF